MPINSCFAGKTMTGKDLPNSVRGKYPHGVPFNMQGFPDFSRYARTTVNIGKFTEDSSDFRSANAKVGLKGNKALTGFVWYHTDKNGVLQLIPRDIHDAVQSYWWSCDLWYSTLKDIYMEYNGIFFEKIAYSEQEIISFASIGIRYDKKMKNSLILEYKEPTEISRMMIDDFEEKYGVNLPEDYKLFLEKTNGGIPEKNVFNIAKTKDIVIGHFFTLSSRVYIYTLEYNNNGDLIKIPNQYFAISDTVNGDYILLNVDKNNKKFGSICIYFYDENNIKKLNICFNDFLNKLHE
jgi:hypothetical protein